MAGTRYDNIDASGFRHGEYVGYGHGTVWRIRRYGPNKWEAIPREADPETGSRRTIIASDLRTISERLRASKKEAKFRKSAFSGRARSFLLRKRKA